MKKLGTKAPGAVLYLFGTMRAQLGLTTDEKCEPLPTPNELRIVVSPQKALLGGSTWLDIHGLMPDGSTFKIGRIDMESAKHGVMYRHSLSGQSLTSSRRKCLTDLVDAYMRANPEVATKLADELARATAPAPSKRITKGSFRSI